MKKLFLFSMLLCMSMMFSASDSRCPDDLGGFVFFFPNPKHCGEYFACDNGTFHIMECGPYLQWNTEFNVCDFPENVDCEKTLKDQAMLNS